MTDLDARVTELHAEIKAHASSHRRAMGQVFRTLARHNRAHWLPLLRRYVWAWRYVQPETER